MMTIEPCSTTSWHQETYEQEQTTLSVKYIDCHGETPRFCTMTCPIDGGATLSCHRHTDMSTASAAGRYYAPASKALQPTRGHAARRLLCISSKNHNRRNALPHLIFIQFFFLHMMTIVPCSTTSWHQETGEWGFIEELTCLMFLLQGQISPANSKKCFFFY